jgi:hypothetical protein
MRDARASSLVFCSVPLSLSLSLSLSLEMLRVFSLSLRGWRDECPLSFFLLVVINLVVVLLLYYFKTARAR